MSSVAGCSRLHRVRTGRADDDQGRLADLCGPSEIRRASRARARGPPCSIHRHHRPLRRASLSHRCRSGENPAEVTARRCEPRPNRGCLRLPLRGSTSHHQRQAGNCVPLARRAYESLSLLVACELEPKLADRWMAGKQIGNAEVRRVLAAHPMGEPEAGTRKLYNFFSKTTHPNRSHMAHRYLGEGNEFVLGAIGRPSLALLADYAHKTLSLWFWFAAFVCFRGARPRPSGRTGNRRNRRDPRGRGSLEIRGSTPCNCRCTSAADAEPGRGAGARASRRPCRTAAAECTEASHPDHRRVIRTPSNTDATRRRRSPAGARFRS